MEFRQKGHTSMAPDPEGTTLFYTTPMHIASCTKTITTIAALIAIENNPNVYLHSKIKDYLPPWWKLGPNIENITFEHLLKHRSGIRYSDYNVEPYGGMRKRIAEGVHATSIGLAEYNNMNFCLFRILIPAISGTVNYNNYPGGDAFNLLDIHTQNFYMQYLEEHIFSPLNITTAGCDNPGGLLYYDFCEPSSGGTNLGNRCNVTGGGRAMAMAPKDLARIIYEAKFGNKLLSKTMKNKMFVEGIPQPLGCYNNQVSPNTKVSVFHHNGGLPKKAQACWYIFDNDIICAVAINSDGGISGPCLMAIEGDINYHIEEAYNDAVVP